MRKISLTPGSPARSLASFAYLMCICDVHTSVLCDVAAVCVRPTWTTRVDQTALGATNPYTRNTVQECLEYCAATLTCIGVDIDRDLRPVRCWPHTNPSDFVDTNIYTQLGTTSYQLLERCANENTTTTTTTTTTTIIGPIPRGNFVAIIIARPITTIIIPIPIIIIIIACPSTRHL